MAYQFFNPNPCKKTVGDCVVRAIACAMDISWDKAYMGVCDEGMRCCDMPSSNAVWSSFLRRNGFRRYNIPDGYTVKDFAYDYPQGIYVLSTGNHTVCCIDGVYYDAWDSGNEAVESYFRKE